MTPTEKTNKQASKPTTIMSKDRTYRNKLVRTMCILFSYTTLGFFYGNLGPALSDIQLLIGQSLDVMSWLFTATYAGSLIGTLICGPVCDRVGPQVVLLASVFMASCLTGVFIYSPNFTFMLIVRVFTGIFIGGVDIGGIASVADLWKSDARPYMHALQFTISLGGIVTPFIIEPFLAQPNILPANTSNHRAGSTNNSRYIFLNDNLTSVKSNEEELFQNNRKSSFQSEVDVLTYTSPYSNETMDFNGSSKITTLEETRIQYAFIIFAVVGVTSSIALLVFVVTDYRTKKIKHKVNGKEGTANLNRTQLSLPSYIKYILLAIIAMQSYLSAALGLKVYAFLPTFFVIQFKWTTSKASVATSGFWIGKAVSRLAGVFLSTKIKQSVLIPCFTIIYIASAICLTASAINQINALAWVVTVTMGIGLSILRSSLFTITEEKITHVSGKVASLYLVLFVLGGMIDPLYTGYLMNDISPMWFTYLLVIESILFLVLFVIVKVLLWYFGNKLETGIEIEIEPMKTERIQ